MIHRAARSRRGPGALEEGPAPVRHGHDAEAELDGEADRLGVVPAKVAAAE